MSKVTNKKYMKDHVMIHTRVPKTLYAQIKKTAGTKSVFVNEVITKALKRGLVKQGASKPR